MCVILYAKYEKAYLNKVVEIQCQHLTITHCNELLTLEHIFEELFDGTLGTWKIYPVDFDFKTGCKANMLVTIPSTEGTRRKVQKVVLMFSPIRIPRGSKRFRTGSPIH